MANMRLAAYCVASCTNCHAGRGSCINYPCLGWGLMDAFATMTIKLSSNTADVD